jgi:hypothetical protein
MRIQRQDISAKRHDMRQGVGPSAPCFERKAVCLNRATTAALVTAKILVIFV